MIVCKIKCFVFLCVFVSVYSMPSDESSEDPDRCGDVKKCVGVGYECIDGRCFCAPGYVPNHFQIRCIKCPGMGEKCFGQCCNHYNNATLHCWQGVCQPCYDPYGNWICRDPMKDILLISTAQVAMGAALVFGIIATFILLYKLCAATNLRPMGDRSNSGTRLSIGSLQLYIDERLRDAPPRYTRAPPAGSSSAYPVAAFTNNGFVHDSSTPPPPYSPPEVKDEDRNTALHI